MNRRTAIAALALTPTLARADEPKRPKLDLPDAPAQPGGTMRAIATVVKSGEEWTAGDLDAFCAHYADDALFVSPSGLTKGRQAVYDRYKKKYGTDKKSMGALSFDILDARGDERFTSILMVWTLTYADKPKATGHSLITLEKKGERWLVVHDASM